ncbi:MAG: prepilin-type N-terminal cleavage/methylation domain-containing protein [Firmicutes bacterium]|nr:prepilin-type N-terminal cleavage/methylation domain-containing protein [Bacillota bacterium]
MFMKMKAAIRDCRGITLIELLVALSLLGLVAAAAFNYFGFAQKSWQMASAEAAVESEARLLLMQLERDIRAVKRGSEDQPGIEIIDEGRGVKLHNFLGTEEIIIEYNYLANGNLQRIESTSEGVRETEYENIYLYDEENVPVVLFTLVGTNQVKLRYFVKPSTDKYGKKIEVDTVFTIRNKGVN